MNIYLDFFSKNNKNSSSSSIAFLTQSHYLLPRILQQVLTIQDTSGQVWTKTILPSLTITLPRIIQHSWRWRGTKLWQQSGNGWWLSRNRSNSKSGNWNGSWWCQWIHSSWFWCTSTTTKTLKNIIFSRIIVPILVIAARETYTKLYFPTNNALNAVDINVENEFIRKSIWRSGHIWSTCITSCGPFIQSVTNKNTFMKV